MVYAYILIDTIKHSAGKINEFTKDIDDQLTHMLREDLKEDVMLINETVSEVLDTVTKHTQRRNKRNVIGSLISSLTGLATEEQLKA